MLGKSHLTSMVTPDIHRCVRLDLVTGPPENVDDDEIQCLGKMLLDSLERSQILAVLPVGPHPCCPSEVIRRAEVVQGRGLEGLELASFPSLWPLRLEKWFRLTDLVVDHHHRGYSLSSAMTLQGCVCEPDGRGRANSNRFPTCLASQPDHVDLTLTPCLVLDTPSRSTLEAPSVFGLWCCCLTVWGRLCFPHQDTSC